jgi:hypothetical protein
MNGRRMQTSRAAARCAKCWELGYWQSPQFYSAQGGCQTQGRVTGSADTMGAKREPCGFLRARNENTQGDVVK